MERGLKSGKTGDFKIISNISSASYWLGILHTYHKLCFSAWFLKYFTLFNIQVKYSIVQESWTNIPWDIHAALLWPDLADVGNNLGGNLLFKRSILKQNVYWQMQSKKKVDFKISVLISLWLTMDWKRFFSIIWFFKNYSLLQQQWKKGFNVHVICLVFITCYMYMSQWSNLVELCSVFQNQK